MGYRRSLGDGVQQAPWFYVVYALMLAFGMGIVLSGVNLIDINIFAQVINVLLPIVLGFLLLLSQRALPEQYWLKGTYAVVV